MEKIDPVKISKNVIRIDGEYWHLYYRLSNVKLKVTGKYLFFSLDKKELEKIVINELENKDFFEAKINTDVNKIDEEYVLCLYYEDDSRKFELANRYKNNPKIKYR